MGLQVTPLVAGQSATATVTGAAAGATVHLLFSLTGPGQTGVSALGVTLGLDQPSLAASVAADPSGTAVFSQTLPGGLAGQTVWLQAAEAGNTSELVESLVQ